jgi:hypothetical protein
MEMAFAAGRLGFQIGRKLAFGIAVPDTAMSGAAGVDVAMDQPVTVIGVAGVVA